MNAQRMSLGIGVSALLPGTVVLATNLGVPPDARTLFIAVAFACPALTVAAIAAGRSRIQALDTRRARRIAVAIALGVGAVLCAYALLFGLCVVHSFDDPEPVFFPLWTTGRAAEMIARAGGRFAALERYGPAALVDAIARMPALIVAMTKAMLVALYAALASAAPAVLAFWSVRETVPRSRRATAGTADGRPAAYVFLCHNAQDKPEVRRVAAALELRGLPTWLDQEQLHPGDPWPEALDKQIRTAPSAAVFIGPSGIGQWQRLEINALLDESVHRGCKVVPILLPAAAEASIPPLLRQFNWIDLRRGAQELDVLADALRGEGAIQRAEKDAAT